MLEDYVNDLNVLYEDNHIMVVEKPVNVLSQKDKTEDIDMTEIITKYLKDKYNKPGNVYVGLLHRLDRRVGGLMVFAKTSKAASRLSEDIRNHQIKKTYLALCLGAVESGKFEDKLIKDEKTLLAKVDKNGKEAILNYWLINQAIIDNNLYSYVLVDLITGRYNQIRCQFSYHNHPLINDKKYKYPFDDKGQLGLFCCRLEFIHPVKKEKMVFSLIPKDGIWKNMEKGKVWQNEGRA